MRSHRRLLSRQIIGLSSLPRRIGNHMLHNTWEFIRARPLLAWLVRGILAYFPALRARLKNYGIASPRMPEENGNSESNPNSRLKKYTDIVPFLADLERMEVSLSPDEALKAMSEMYLKLAPANHELTTLDPFSTEYKSAVMKLYEQISNVKNYEPTVNERTPYVDVAKSVHTPSPYVFGSSKVVGDFISSWGWIFQVLDVKQGDKVLEYGAGEGQLSIMLSRMGVDVAVIDIDERYLESIHSQCVSLGISISLKQGEFGDAFDDQKFDRILFFEAFHHAVDHLAVVRKLKPLLKEGGFVVFSGEPIVVSDSVEASFVPFPWGPRLDGLAVRTSNKYGWFELGFQQGYFVEMLMRAGWLVKYSPCPVTGRGNCYVAIPSTGEIDLGAPYVVLRSGGEAGWHSPEGTHRWTKRHAFLPLPEEYEKHGGQATLTLANYLPVERVVNIAAGTDKGICRLEPGQEQAITVSLSPCRYLHLYTDPVVPSDIVPESSDRRELGVAVVRIKLHSSGSAQ